MPIQAYNMHTTPTTSVHARDRLTDKNTTMSGRGRKGGNGSDEGTNGKMMKGIEDAQRLEDVIVSEGIKAYTKAADFKTAHPEFKDFEARSFRTVFNDIIKDVHEGRDGAHSRVFWNVMVSSMRCTCTFSFSRHLRYPSNSHPRAARQCASEN